jgi:hypothetical protein
MTFNFLVGTFVILGIFGGMAFVADYILPHFMEDGE